MNFSRLQQDSLAWRYICKVAGRFGQNISLSKWDGRIINFGANPQQKLYVFCSGLQTNILKSRKWNLLWTAVAVMVMLKQTSGIQREANKKDDMLTVACYHTCKVSKT